MLNNCATRPRDLIEQAVGGLSYPPSEHPDATYRDIMTHYGCNYPWYQFGIDLALGQGIDRPISVRQQMFAPIILMKEMAGATYKTASGQRVGIVESTSTLVEGSENAVLPPTPFLLSPPVYMLADIRAHRRCQQSSAWCDASKCAGSTQCGSR